MKRKNKRRVVHREPEQVYFEIANPNQLRRQILTGAIEIVDTLKEYEVSKDVKIEKEKQIRQLKGILSGMKSNFRLLKNCFSCLIIFLLIDVFAFPFLS